MSYAVYDDRHHFGPELGIGQVLGASFDEPVLLIKTAWGAKSLAVDFRPPSAGGATGPFYRQMLDEFRVALAGIDTAFPQYAQHVPRVEGVIWFQGWNDGCDEAAAAKTGNMDNFVLREGQKAGCARSEVGGGARFVPTAAFLRKPEDCPNPGHGHHWFGSAESYLLIGDALGRAMADLLDERAGETPN